MVDSRSTASWGNVGTEGLLPGWAIQEANVMIGRNFRNIRDSGLSPIKATMHAKQATTCKPAGILQGLLSCVSTDSVDVKTIATYINAKILMGIGIFP